MGPVPREVIIIIGAGNLVAGQGGGAALDVFIAGEFEGVQFLHMTPQQTLGTGRSSAIKILG